MSPYIKRCDLAKQYQYFKPRLDKVIQDVLKKGIYTLGEQTVQFEKEFSAYIGQTHGISVASGTDALILALKSAGIQRGDEVITTTYAPTPVATAIVQAGGIPVFADIDPETCLIDPDEIERKISPRTKCIIPVHLFGFVCQMDIIQKLASKQGLVVIEDVAQGHGSSLNHKKAGSFGKLACFSFYPTKNLGGYGDGGMILTSDKKTADHLRLLRNYGKKDNVFDSAILGFNSRLDEIQAAILRVKLCDLDGMNKKRIKWVRLYEKELKNTPLFFLKSHDHVSPTYHVLVALYKENRDGLVAFLNSQKIQTNIYYPTPLHRMLPYQPFIKKNEKFPISEKISKEAFALPLYPEMKGEQVMFIIRKIKYFFRNQ